MKNLYMNTVSQFIISIFKFSRNLLYIFLLLATTCTLFVILDLYFITTTMFVFHDFLNIVTVWGVGILI